MKEKVADKIRELMELANYSGYAFSITVQDYKVLLVIGTIVKDYYFYWILIKERPSRRCCNHFESLITILRREVGEANMNITKIKFYRGSLPFNTAESNRIVKIMLEGNYKILNEYGRLELSKDAFK